MIKIQMKRYGKTVEVPVMSSSEDVYLALWKLGLDRDMAKYTLEGLEAVFLYDTPLEHQMIRTISSTMKLQDALYVLNHLTTPPAPIAMELWEDLRDGYCHTSGFVMREIQRMIEEEAVEEEQEQKQSQSQSQRMDKKLRQEIREKKQALGLRD